MPSVNQFPNALESEVDGASATPIDIQVRAPTGGLDRRSRQEPEPGDVDASIIEDAEKRHEFLRGARQKVDQDSPVTLTVRELLAHWGAVRRGAVVTQQVSDELANHGLVTLPDFRAVTLDSTVALVHLPGVGDGEGRTSSQDLPDDEDVGLALGNIPSALSGVESVNPDASLEEAITLMRLNDYSQLAVMAGKRQLKGAVTWRSIAEAQHFRRSNRLGDAVVGAREFRYDHDLIDALGAILEHDFVFVRNQENEIAGIVTAADVVNAYGELATPFFMIGEIDRRLRRLIRSNFTLDEINRTCGFDGAERIQDFDDLTFGVYQRMLECPSHWQRLEWPIDRRLFIQRLEQVRNYRNDLTHFNPDPLPAEALPQMRLFLKLLREVSD